MAYIRSFGGTPDQLRLDSGAKKLITVKTRPSSAERSA
jgi:hypothetical protein